MLTGLRGNRCFSAEETNKRMAQLSKDQQQSLAGQPASFGCDFTRKRRGEPSATSPLFASVAITLGGSLSDRIVESRVDCISLTHRRTRSPHQKPLAALRATLPWRC